MRLPLRHPPPDDDPPRHCCGYLEALAVAAEGLPLGPAAALLSGRRSRGRHGNALQWHLGLDAHDGQAQPDWEDRIEIKLVTVWRRSSGIVCDKLKVCAIEVDPWAKLANVLWVFADGLSRVVVGHRFSHLAGPSRERLAESWAKDPHFDAPDLFVESRGDADAADPAYYLAASWFAREGLLPGPARPGIFAPVGSGALPTKFTVVDRGEQGTVACPRCGAPLRFDPEELARHARAVAHHGLPLEPCCATYRHVVLTRAQLVPPQGCTWEEATAAIEGRETSPEVWRLCDRVPEPEDHGH